MTAINILVTSGTETRIIIIAGPEQYGDVTGKIQTLFNIPVEYRIKLKRFSDDWQEWLNIEPSELQNRDKIRVESFMPLEFSSLANTSFSSVTDASTSGDVFESTLDSLECDLSDGPPAILLDSDEEEKNMPEQSGTSKGDWTEEQPGTSSATLKNAVDR